MTEFLQMAGFQRLGADSRTAIAGEVRFDNAIRALYASRNTLDRPARCFDECIETTLKWLRMALWTMAALLPGQFATPAVASDQQLFEAIEEGKELVAEGLVIRKRANVNARNADGDTPLHRAVEKGMRGLAEVLLKHGSNARARAKSGETPLHLAALHSEPAYLDMLLAAGADPRARTDQGESVLLWAALTGHIVIVQRLLEAGADANVGNLKGNLPLHAAADGGHLEVVRLLLPKTAEPGAKNREGLTARDYARNRGNQYIEKLLERAN